MNRNLGVAAFVLGLVVVLWVGVGYAAAWHPLALVMTALIGAFYLMGALELRRFQQGTTGLQQALAKLPEAPAQLEAWLAALHPTLQHPVRQRIEGARVPLPGPALTPYLVGLLVMLGMLGTFLGMVVTLNGAVLALESTTDLATIRAALSAPVKGLGLAFGTSVAGVAASAMLGLMSATCRRERLQAAQALDAGTVGVLRAFSPSQQREQQREQQRQQMVDTLQAQARVVPDAVSQLQATMQAFITQMERQSQAQTDRLLAGQEAFFRHSQSVVAELATSVDRSMQQSLADTARLTGATLQPLAEATLAGITREATALHERVAGTVAQQLDGVSARLGQSAGAMEAAWGSALARHEEGSAALAQRLQQTMDAFADSFEQRSARLLAAVDSAQAAGQTALAETWRQALAEHQRTSAETTAALQQALAAQAERQAQQSAALIDTVRQESAALAQAAAQQSAAVIETQGRQSATLIETLRQESAALTQSTAQQSAAVIETQARQSATLIETLQQETAAIAQATAQQSAAVIETQSRQSATLIETLQQETAAIAQSTAQQSAALIEAQTRQSAALIETQTRQSTALIEAQAQQSAALIERTQQLSDTLLQTSAQQSAALLEKNAQQSATLMDGAARQSASVMETVAQHSSTVLETLARESAAWMDTSTRHAAELLARLETAQAALQADIAARDTQRQAQLAQSLEAMAAALKQEWSAAGAATAEHQQRICHTLEQTAQQMHAQAESHARATIGEIAQLTHTAAEAPRAAAELMGQLRQQLSDSLVRDTELLEERQRIMDTLRTLLDAIQHAATEQRGAIDALVASSSTLLQQVGTQLTERVGVEADRLNEVAAQVTGSALEVGALGEAFTTGVQRFSESSDGLIGTLQRIEAALAKSSARSDEQLAYYVAQAREIIDLSMLSQKQIVEDLQQLQRRQAAAAVEAD
jgi:hypothetical protein